MCCRTSLPQTSLTQRQSQSSRLPASWALPLGRWRSGCVRPCTLCPTVAEQTCCLFLTQPISRSELHPSPRNDSGGHQWSESIHRCLYCMCPRKVFPPAPRGSPEPGADPVAALVPHRSGFHHWTAARLLRIPLASLIDGAPAYTFQRVLDVH